jgi:hypothetical protein
MGVLGKIVQLCDFVDRVIVKCLCEGIVVVAFAMPAMLVAVVDGLCLHHWRRFGEGAAG